MSLSSITYFVEIITTGNNETFDNIIYITLCNNNKILFQSYKKIVFDHLVTRQCIQLSYDNKQDTSFN